MPKSKQKSKKKQRSAAPSTLSLKERLVQKRKVARERKELIRFTTFAVFLAAIFGLLLGLVVEPNLGIGTAVAVLCLTLSFKYPRQALWAFLIYMPFSGTITYSISTSPSPFLQLAKDALYFPALVGIIQYCRRHRLPVLIPKALMPPLGILLAFCLITLVFVNGFQQLWPEPTAQPLLLAEPPDQPLLLGILGLKVLLGYIPLIVCAYYLLRNMQDFLFLTRLHVVLALVCCGLAFIQYIFLTTGRCTGTIGEGADLFKTSLRARCLVGGSLLYSPEQGLIRLPGTFVAPWQWGWFLISNAFFTFASAFNDPSFIWRIASLGSMASIFIMAVLSGQRIALGLVPVAFVFLLFLTGQIANLKRFIPIGVGLAIILGIATAINPEILQERVDSFSGRWNASPPQQFIAAQFQVAWKAQEGFLGNGLARATNAARVLGKTILLETYYPKILYEIGPFGMLAFLVFVTTLTVVTFKAYRSIKNQSLRSYGASLWVFILLISYNTYYYPLDVEPVAIYYWFFAGVILKLPELDKLERLKEADQERNESRGRKLHKGFAKIHRR